VTNGRIDVTRHGANRASDHILQPRYTWLVWEVHRNATFQPYTALHIRSYSRQHNDSPRPGGGARKTSLGSSVQPVTLGRSQPNGKADSARGQTDSSVYKVLFEPNNGHGRKEPSAFCNHLVGSDLDRLSFSMGC
ncbi:hypothetical protein P879_03071, partial [Paragonimus westermani]